MAETTGIQWADSTLNLWIGCTQVSPACDHCYAMRFAPRLGIAWNAPPHRTAVSTWNKIAGYQRGAKRFIAQHGRPRRVFVNSLSDFADNQAEQIWRDTACFEMEQAPDVIWMLVTKRPQLLRRQVPRHWLSSGVWAKGSGWPPNVWVLVTTENQVEYDRRVIALLDIPAAVRGVSMEPMLEPIDPWAHRRSTTEIARRAAQINRGREMPRYIRQLEWAIVGGESGRGARPMPEDSAQRVVSIVGGEGSAVFVKQLSQADHPVTYGEFETFPRNLQHREHPAHV